MKKQQLIISIILLCFLVYSFVVEPNKLVVQPYEIVNKNLSGVRLVFVTDFHFGRDTSKVTKRLNQIVKLTEKLSPDIVLLGGDYLNAKKLDDKDIAILSSLASKFSLLNVPVYAVLGERDWESDRGRIISTLKSYGVPVLDNSNKTKIIRGKEISIVGISDFKASQPNIEKSLYKSASLKIIVTHNPDIYYDILNKVDLILAGHTHGGQFVIPHMPALFVDSKFGAKFASGLIEDSGNTMIISKGIGTSGLPLRMGCPPEIVVVDFVKKSGKK